MAVPMEDVVGPENMDPAKKETVLEQFLKVAEISVHEAKHALASWGREVNADINYGDFARLGLKRKRRP